MFNSQIILSGILVYIGAAARNLPVFLWNIIKSRLGVSLEADTVDLQFELIEKNLEKLK